MQKPRNTTMVPRGMWHVTLPETGVRMEHNNWNAFMGLVKAHLEANNLDTNGWRDRVADLVCQQNEFVDCSEEGLPSRSWTGEDMRRFLKTMWEAVESGAEAVSDEEQQRRILICNACPQKGLVTCSGGCGSIAKFISEMVIGRKAPNIPDVHKTSCMVCGCELSTLTLYPLDVLKRIDERMFPGENLAYDSKCWKLEAQSPQPPPEAM